MAKRSTGDFLFYSARKKFFTDVEHFYGNTVWSIVTKSDGTVWRTPTQQIAPETLVDITFAVAGNGHAAAIRKDGRVVVWGSRYGDEKENLRRPPVEMDRVIDIASSQHGVAAVDQSGEVHYWESGKSDGISKMLGDGAVAIEGSIFDFVVLTKSGEVYQFAGKGLSNARVPKACMEGGPFQKVRSNGSTRAAQKADGSWVAWGKNGGGIVDHINSLGPAHDIAFFTEPGSDDFGYVVWIEP